MGINLELPQESSMQSQHGMANSGLSTIGASNGFAVQQPKCSAAKRRSVCNGWLARYNLPPKPKGNKFGGIGLIYALLHLLGQGLES